MTHEEAIDAALNVFWPGMADLIGRVDMASAIAAYLEARGAVLATKLTTAWLIEVMHEGRCMNSEVAFIPSYAEKSKSLGYEVTPLHAALSDKGDAS